MWQMLGNDQLPSSKKLIGTTMETPGKNTSKTTILQVESIKYQTIQSALRKNIDKKITYYVVYCVESKQILCTKQTV